MKTYLNTHLEDVILPIIKNAEKEIFICSPYITSKYANSLVGKCKSGIDTKVITTDEESDYHQEALNIFYDVRKKPTLFKKIAAGLLVLAVISVLLSILIIYFLILTGIFGASLYLAWRKYRSEVEEWGERRKEEGKLDIEINNNLHAKLFSADRIKAVVGSCNLTYSGLAKSMEFAMKLEGKEAENLINMFEKKLGRSR